MFNELIKNYEKIREYMRDFYVYGFKSREEFDKKSFRSYDDEKRRIESYLGEYMHFIRTQDGKNMFIEIDTRHISRNPLYKSLMAKSFTNKDITLHFIIFDILNSPSVAYSITEIIDKIEREYLSNFDEPLAFDESTIRKKLKEYASEGVIEIFKEGKTNYYKRASDIDYKKYDVLLQYFSEAYPVGALGSFILDKLDTQVNIFAFKHHYLTEALDSDILCSILIAIREKRLIEVKNKLLKGEEIIKRVVPLQIFASSQGGRVHLICYDILVRRLTSLRIDKLSDVKLGDKWSYFDKMRARLEDAKKHMWGVVIREKTEHIEFTIEVNEGEEYIINRLNREKRVGTIERLDKNHYKFSAQLFDAWEIVPWIRTFICRITSISFSDPDKQQRFFDDFNKLCEMYN